MNRISFAGMVCLAAAGASADLDIRNYGASEAEVCTAAIQKALDEADRAGGGTVVIPAGTWTTGTMWLRSRVELHLEKGAVLKGSTHMEDYNSNDAFPENFWNGEAAHLMKRLSEAGHSVGLHGLRHADADEAIATMGADRYYKEEIEPQLEPCRVAYIPVRSFAYPNCRRSDEADALFRRMGFKHVRGGHKGVTPYDPRGEKQDGLKPIHTVDSAFFPSSESPVRFRLDTVIAGEAYHTDLEDILKCIRRSFERKEVSVLASHGISPNAKGINMKTEWLERILATAKECGVAVLGFDEL